MLSFSLLIYLCFNHTTPTFQDYANYILNTRLPLRCVHQQLAIHFEAVGSIFKLQLGDTLLIATLKIIIKEEYDVSEHPALL